jgi:sugar/nucleoside kinase (ribokinase family)
LHIASYFLQKALQPGLADLFHRAHQNDVTTSLDPNWDPDERWAGLDELLPLIDVLLPNKAEALSLSRQPDLESAARVLAEMVGLLAVKLGSSGGLARRGSLTLHCRGIPIRIVDTVGAGDSFDAGFLFGYLNGWELGKSLQLGTVCGALSTLASGGTHAQPTLNQAMDMINQMGDCLDDN